MNGYPYQAVDHGASISAESKRGDPDQIVIEIVRGAKKPARITMWREDFERMVRDVSNGA